MAAVRALIPALGDCLPPGVALPMRPSMLRSFLAEAAYRVSVAPTPAARPAAPAASPEASKPPY